MKYVNNEYLEEIDQAVYTALLETIFEKWSKIDIYKPALKIKTNYDQIRSKISNCSFTDSQIFQSFGRLREGSCLQSVSGDGENLEITLNTLFAMSELAKLKLQKKEPDI